MRESKWADTWRMPKSGIPQGTVLGPTLFLLYINDLPEKLEETAIFADDTTVYASGKNSSEISAHLSTDLTSASTWSQNWGMQFAAEKSSHLTILAQQQQRSLVKVEVKRDGVTIPAVKRHKHLGVTIDENLTWQDHINSIHTTCARQIGILARLRNVLSNINRQSEEFSQGSYGLNLNMQVPSGVVEILQSF